MRGASHEEGEVIGAAGEREELEVRSVDAIMRGALHEEGEVIGAAGEREGLEVRTAARPRGTGAGAFDWGLSVSAPARSRAACVR